MNRWNVILFFAVGLLSVPQQSMRELAHEQGGHVANVIGVEFGMTKVDAVMAQAQLVLHGQVVDVQVHLSPDESLVVTDYIIAPLHVLKKKTHEVVGVPVVVRRGGGELTEDGLRFSTTVDAYPESESFRTGEEVIVMLTRDPEAQLYHLVGGPFGAFRLRHGKVQPMTREVIERRGDKPVELGTFLDALQKGQP